MGRARELHRKLEGPPKMTNPKAVGGGGGRDSCPAQGDKRKRLTK